MGATKQTVGPYGATYQGNRWNMDYGAYLPPTPKPTAPQGASATAPAPSPFAPAPMDPRLSGLLDELGKQPKPYAPSVAPADGPNFDGINAQAGQLRDLMSELMAGRGPSVGPVAGDAEAKAFRTARTREAEGARAAEADRLAASGLPGSGDFDSQVAKINEATGTDIAGFEGALAGRRKQEATAAATTGANLQLADLGRQQTQIQSQYDADQRAAELSAQEQFQQAQLDQQRRSDLLAALMSQQQFSADLGFRSADEARKQTTFTASPIPQAAAAKAAGPYWDPRLGWVAA